MIPVRIVDSTLTKAKKGEITLMYSLAEIIDISRKGTKVKNLVSLARYAGIPEVMGFVESNKDTEELRDFVYIEEGEIKYE